MIRIAIDGPGGAGKSSLAKAVARELGIIYVDTGALYRNIGLYCLRRGADCKNKEEILPLLPEITLELKFEEGRQIITLNGTDEGENIRTPEVSLAASAVSAIPEVRQFLLDMQRETARKNSVIMDGRDIGTVILPDAEVKIFLTASPEARAKRRFLELSAKGIDTTYEKVYDEMVERDKNDSTRAVAPCVPAKDATLLDNSKLDEAGTLKAVLKIIKKKSKKKLNFYAKAKRIVAPIYKFFWRVRARGVENVPMDGGFILCSNHISALDVVSIGAVCPRQLTFVAKKEVFSAPVIGWFAKNLEAIKVDRAANDLSAIKASVEACQNGRVLSIFPQGHRYPGVDPKTTPTKNGAALMAYRSGCDVLPVCLNIKKCRYAPFRKIEVVFGKLIKNSELGFVNGGNDEYKHATDIIFKEIISLGSFEGLPTYDPENDKILKKKKRSRKRGK